MHVHLETLSFHDAALLIKSWTNQHDIRVLNIAGPGASKDPAIYNSTMHLLEMVFEGTKYHSPARLTEPHALTELTSQDDFRVHT